MIYPFVVGFISGAIGGAIAGWAGWTLCLLTGIELCFLIELEFLLKEQETGK